MNKSKVLNLTAFALFSWPSKLLCALSKSRLFFNSTINVLFLFYLIPCIADESGNVILLLSGETQVYQTVADFTTREIKKKCSFIKPICSDLKFEKVIIGQESSTPINDALMMIVFGTKAASDSITTNFNRQMIISMIPRQSSLPLDNNTAGKRITRIFIDQPFERYLSLINAVAPRATRVGLLLHSSDEHQRESILSAAEDAGFRMVIGTVDSNDEIGETLSRMLGSIDLLLALPDSRIHNSKTISNILTTSYRNHIPVVAFSSAYVKAGATAAVFTSLNDISQQVSDVAIKMLNNNATDIQSMSAEYFSVSINFDVARSLGIALRSPSEIKETMLKGKSK